MHLASCDRMSVAGGSGHTYPEARACRRGDRVRMFFAAAQESGCGTSATCPDEACRSAFKAKTDVHRRPPIHTVPLGEARLSAYTSLPPGRAYGKPNYLLPSADRGYCLQAEQPGHCQLALRPFDVGADRKLGRLTRRRRHALSPPDRRADEALATAADC